MSRMAIHEHGDESAMRLERVPVPQIKPNEVLVRLHAAGVNFIDTYQVSGLYKVPEFPFTPGQEGAGIVEAVGDLVEDIAVGDHVVTLRGSGCYAEFSAVDCNRVIPIPKGMDMKTA